MTKEDISMEHFTIVRHFRRSRSEQEYLSAAYEIILPKRNTVLSCSELQNEVNVTVFSIVRRCL